jgi:hypothetical protein
VFIVAVALALYTCVIGWMSYQSGFVMASSRSDEEIRALKTLNESLKASRMEAWQEWRQMWEKLHPQETRR